MGTEFGLPCVAPMPVNKVLEWIPNMAEDGPFVEGQAIDEQDEWDVQVPGAAPEPVEVGLHGALRVPTLMHVVSNASNDMLVGAEVLQESVEQLSAVAKLMDSKHSRARLKAIHVSVAFSSSFAHSAASRIPQLRAFRSFAHMCYRMHTSRKVINQKK